MGHMTSTRGCRRSSATSLQFVLLWALSAAAHARVATELFRNEAGQPAHRWPRCPPNAVDSGLVNGAALAVVALVAVTAALLVCVRHKRPASAPSPHVSVHPPRLTPSPPSAPALVPAPEPSPPWHIAASFEAVSEFVPERVVAAALRAGGLAEMARSLVTRSASIPSIDPPDLLHKYGRKWVAENAIDASTKLGAGALGQVYAGQHRGLAAAFKVINTMKPYPAMLRFVRKSVMPMVEVREQPGFPRDHPHLLPLLDAVVFPPWYLLLEFGKGTGWQEQEALVEEDVMSKSGDMHALDLRMRLSASPLPRSAKPPSAPSTAALATLSMPTCESSVLQQTAVELVKGGWVSPAAIALLTVPEPSRLDPCTTSEPRPGNPYAEARRRREASKSASEASGSPSRGRAPAYPFAFDSGDTSMCSRSTFPRVISAFGDLNSADRQYLGMSSRGSGHATSRSSVYASSQASQLEFPGAVAEACSWRDPGSSDDLRAPSSACSACSCSGRDDGGREQQCSADPWWLWRGAGPPAPAGPMVESSRRPHKSANVDAAAGRPGARGDASSSTPAAAGVRRAAINVVTQVIMVTPLCELGTLSALLDGHNKIPWRAIPPYLRSALAPGGSGGDDGAAAPPPPPHALAISQLPALWQIVCKLQLCLQVVDGVSALHAAALVHCDIKPDNIFLKYDPALKPFGICAKIGDMDTCRSLSLHSRLLSQTSGQLEVESAASDSTHALYATMPSYASSSGHSLMPSDVRTSHFTSCVKGTPGFLAPEMIALGRVARTTDVYSLAVSISIALSKSYHFLRYDQLHLSIKCEFPDAIDGSLRRTLAQCLRPEPAGRPTLEQLQAVLQSQFDRVLLSAGRPGD